MATSDESPAGSRSRAKNGGQARPVARLGSALGPLLSALDLAAREAQEATRSRKLPRLLHEVKIQNVSLKLAEMQAKVAQEVAIAERIQNAYEVEIEESYEGADKGSIGLGTDLQSSANLGMSGESKRVSKRVYRFKGYLGLEEQERVEEQGFEEIAVEDDELSEGYLDES